MARSKGVTISVKVPINWEIMTEKKQQRLRQIAGRDTRAIRAFLGIIEQHEDKLLAGRKKKRIHEGKLSKLTLTAIKVKAGYSQRTSVPHDMKTRFPRMSVNELTECRQTAISLYDSYLVLRRRKGRRASHPCAVNSTRRIPRWTFVPRFEFLEQRTSIGRWWLDLRDSLDSVPEGRRYHDHLLIPLKVSPFHLNQFHRGEIKAVQVFKDRTGKWWTTFAVRVQTPNPPNDSLPPAVLGIDLGIKKAACTTFVTPKKVRETKYFKQKEKFESLKKLDTQVSVLQKEMDSRNNFGLPYDKVALKLRKIRNKRENVSREYDRVLIGQIRNYIIELSKKYTVYVAIGRLRYIRQGARKGNYKGRKFRGMIHSWSFARITGSLSHQLAQLGWSVKGKDSRYRIVPENWTSIMCWKCGRKGIRPKQSLFVCPTCGNKCNADMNGAINIAGRLITLTDSLHSVRGQGKWNDAILKAKSPRPKAQGNLSRGKSLLSKKGQSSSPRESAAPHHVQMDLLSFSDESEKGENDLAVEKTVETISAAVSDVSAMKQDEEAKSVGGIASR